MCGSGLSFTSTLPSRFCTKSISLIEIYDKATTKAPTNVTETDRSVGELETLHKMRQAAVNQMLAHLREEGLMEARREGKTVFYALSDQNTARDIELLYDPFADPMHDRVSSRRSRQSPAAA